MKRTLIVLSLILSVVVNLNAQERQERQVRRGEAINNNMEVTQKTPEQKAEELTNLAIQKLSLSESQKKPFYEDALKYYQKEAELKRFYNNDKSKIDPELEKYREELIEQSNAYLTPTQVKKIRTEIIEHYKNKEKREKKNRE